MENKNLDEKIREIMTDNDACEKLAEAFFDSVESDDEPLHKIGFYLMRAFLDGSVDDAMIALCGWSFETLLVKAELLPDTEHIFN